MQNSIINACNNFEKESIYEKFLIQTIEDFKDNKSISINSKILHYLPNPTLYFYINVYKNTDINPFNNEIIISVEFINGEIPYVAILTDFIEPTYNDNRNYYRCLTKEHDYIFSLENFEDSKNILKLIILGIKNFLTFIKETNEIDCFVYFGEYEFSHIYQVNDFLRNKFEFYRIFEIKDNEKTEIFIIFTHLYFMIFQPLEFDKCLIKLIFYMELNEINFVFDKKNINQSLVLDLNKTHYKDNLEFVLINRKQKNNKKEDNIFNLDYEEEEDEFDYSSLIKNWFVHQNKNLNIFKKFNLIIKNYRIIFNESRDKLESAIGKNLDIDEYNKLIEFYERIIEYNKNKNVDNTNNNERLHKLISDIVNLCSELVNYDKTKNNQYLMKIKKYLNSYK